MYNSLLINVSVSLIVGGVLPDSFRVVMLRVTQCWAEPAIYQPNSHPIIILSSISTKNFKVHINIF